MKIFLEADFSPQPEEENMTVSVIQRNVKETILLRNKISIQTGWNTAVCPHNQNQLREKIKGSYPGQSQL